MDARKAKYGPTEAVELARQVDHLWIARGKSVKYFNMNADPPTDEELIQLMTGRTGNLRAPTIRRGKKLFVGFQREQLESNLLK